MKYDYAEIIDDSDKETANKENDLLINKKTKPTQSILKKYHNENDTIVEIGVDEVGRGPLFGRVYTAAVILPKDDTFDCSKVKDSKKFHSKKKIQEVAKYIKENALAWHVSFEDEKIIDDINILQATQRSMHTSIREVQKKMNNKMNDTKEDYSYNLLIDGNYFNPIMVLNKKTQQLENTPYITVEKGDNTYASIAAASILAKVERDEYINELCTQHPTLCEYYGIDSNKGYGAKKHLDGIKKHGISMWHRKTFGICKKYV